MSATMLGRCSRSGSKDVVGSGRAGLDEVEHHGRSALDRQDAAEPYERHGTGPFTS
jgi:hypothetical protein